MGKSVRSEWERRVREIQAKHPRAVEPDDPSPASIGRVRGAKAVVVDGIRFGSKLEADHYRELKLLQLAGEVLYFLRQVPFVVATGVTYRLDFLVVWNRSGGASECITYHETKGHMTDTARVKIAAVQDRYRIVVRILKRSDVARFR